jgi:hypothetical protein
MGHYTQNLFRRNRQVRLKKSKQIDPENIVLIDEDIFVHRDDCNNEIDFCHCSGPLPHEKLVSCGLVRNDVLYKGANSHYKLRMELGDVNPSKTNTNDKSGFITNKGRFVDRSLALEIGCISGQCYDIGIPLNSGDVSW